MKVDEKLVAKIAAAVEKPVLVGKVLQICLIPDDDEKTKAIVRMYLDADVARLRAKHIAPAIAFFASLSEGTATVLSKAICHELSSTRPALIDIIEGRPEDGMRSVPEFQYGCIVGLLEGVAQSSGYAELTQRTLGHDLIQIIKSDKSEEVNSSACYGGISNAVAEISDKYPHLVSAFFEGMNQCPAEWLEGAYPRRICECFLHQVLSIPKFTLKEQALVLKPVHDRLRFEEPKEKPVATSV